MYSLPFIVSPSRCDEHRRLKLFSALQMLQDCSEMWLTSEPELLNYFETEGRAQFLAFRQVDVVRIPEIGERLTVSTSIFETNPMFGFRNTFIYDEKHQPCYKTWGVGAFVSRNTGKLTRIEKNIYENIVFDPKLEMDYCDRHIRKPEGAFAPALSFNIGHNDIDYNHHVNNAQYVRMALEVLPQDFTIHRMLIEHRAPVKFGETIQSEILETKDNFYIIQKTKEKVCTFIAFS